MPQEIVTLDLQPIPYASITVLTLQGRMNTSVLINDCLSKFRFPQLRVFAITNCTVFHPITIFQFIHRHSTLAEVNVDRFPDYPFCIEAVLSLINGSGDWYDEIAPRTHRDMDHISRWPSPVVAPGVRVVCYGFAYTRTILHSPTQIGDPSKQTYLGSTWTCTALALRWLHVCLDDEGGVKPPFLTVLRNFHSLFPDVEELRLQVNDTEHPMDRINFYVSILLLCEAIPSDTGI